jgi:hypothetical protein
MKKLILFLVTTTLFLVGVNAQVVLTAEDMNSVYKKEKHHNKRVQQYSHLRQADVMWSRKIWREIDLRQKINHPFHYPENNGIVGSAMTGDRKSLIDVIYSAVKEGSITAYGNAVYDDEFRQEMSQEEIKLIGGASETIIEVIDWDAVAEGADPEEAKTTKFPAIAPILGLTFIPFKATNPLFLAPPEKHASITTVALAVGNSVNLE